jgi:hypothetical protein
VLKTTPGYLLGIEDIPGISAIPGLGATTAELDSQTDIGAERRTSDADLIAAAADVAQLTLRHRLRTYLRSLGTAGADQLSTDMIIRDGNFSHLAEFGRSFGLLDERTTSALHKLGTMQWYAEHHASEITSQSMRHWVEEFLKEVLNPFADFQSLGAAELRAEFMMACAVVYQVLAGNPDAAEDLRKVPTVEIAMDIIELLAPGEILERDEDGRITVPKDPTRVRIRP